MVDKSQKVLVTSNDFPESGLQMLRDSYTLLQSKYSGYDKADAENNQKEVSELIKGVSAVIWATSNPLTDDLLDIAGPQLKIVSCASAGYDHVDITELKERGIKLSNTPNVLNAAVADVTVGLIIAASRRFNEGVINVNKGDWKAGFQVDLGVDIKGSVVGIVGLGRIGQAIVKRLKGFEVKQFLYTGRSNKKEGSELGVEFVSLDQLLRESDFVILACPMTPETKHLINKNTLQKMKPQSVLINIGRGGCVNHDDLYEALKNKQIYAAGLDVTAPEPLPKGHPLTTLPNCYITPHIGSATINTRNRMAELAALNAIQAIRNGPLLSEVAL